MYRINVYCTQWTYIVYTVSIRNIEHNGRILCLFWSLCPLCTMNVQWTYIGRDVSITSTILIKRLLCSMDVQCVYCVHCVHYTYYAHWMPPTKTQPSTNRCKAGVSIVDNKMDTMDIDFVHWTCPLVTNNEHTVSIVSIGDQWTFSTFWYVANGRINGRPLNVHWTWSLYTMWRMYTMGTPNRSCCTFTIFCIVKQKLNFTSVHKIHKI